MNFYYDGLEIQFKYWKQLSGRYVAPEVFKSEQYDTKVDVFSFALILQEVNIFFFSCGFKSQEFWFLFILFLG